MSFVEFFLSLITRRAIEVESWSPPIALFASFVAPLTGLTAPLDWPAAQLAGLGHAAALPFAHPAESSAVLFHR